MNYRDLQNISNLSQQILVEGANEEHNVLNRWPYTSPYLQESTELDEASVTDDRVRRNQKAFGSNYTPPRDWDQSANRGKGTVLNTKQKEKQRRKGLAKGAMGEAVDLYDIILSHLLDEGYAETQEQAEVIMVNMSEEWRESIVEEVLEEGAAGDVAARAATLARQRKGQTSERKKMYQELASKAAARERGPFQGGDTRTGMTTSDRERRRESDAYHDSVFGDGTRTYGEGGITKNPRKLAQQKARGQHG